MNVSTTNFETQCDCTFKYNHVIYINILGCRRWVSILSEKKSKCYNLQTYSNTRIKTVIKKVPVMCFNLVKIGSVEFV